MNSFPKRTFYSLVIVLLWLGFVVDGAHAIFTSTAILNGNMITSGTSNLLISNSQNPNPSTFDSSAPGFNYSLAPGETEDRYIFLYNSSSNNTALDLFLSVNSNDNRASFWFPSVALELHPVDSNGVVSTEGFTGTLGDINLSGHMATGLVLPSGAIQRYLMRVVLNSSWSDQGAALGYNLQFIGSQHLN